MNETVTAGNWFRRICTSEPVRKWMLATEVSFTIPLVVVLVELLVLVVELVELPDDAASQISSNAAGDCWNRGATSSTTRYWFDWVKMVEISRWPKALYSAVSTSAAVIP
ncbi:hypothetical protein EPYR_03129 [Erwinia pyrifoliae DSM 12163]|nr:hypothetical protein EPYR_03129 [Erwinia pyrifoliae DSM 12163]